MSDEILGNYLLDEPDANISFEKFHANFIPTGRKIQDDVKI